MKKEKTHALRTILAQHSICRPLPSSLRKRLPMMKRVQLREILKQKGTSGIIPFLATGIYFFMKNRGFSVTMKHSGYGARVLCVTAWCAASAGLLYLLLSVR
jgi:hypothetical protein